MKKLIISILILVIAISFSITISQSEYEQIIHRLKDLAILEDQTPTFVLQPIHVKQVDNKLIFPNTVDGTMTLGYIVYNFKLDLPIVKDTINTKIHISPVLVSDFKTLQGFGVDFNYDIGKLGGGIFLDEWEHVAPKLLDQILDYLQNNK